MSSSSKQSLNFSIAPIITAGIHGGGGGGGGGGVPVLAEHTILKAANMREGGRCLWTCSDGKADQRERGILGLWIVDWLAVHIAAESAAFGAGIVV